MHLGKTVFYLGLLVLPTARANDSNQIVTPAFNHPPSGLTIMSPVHNFALGNFPTSWSDETPTSLFDEIDTMLPGFEHNGAEDPYLPSSRLFESDLLRSVKSTTVPIPRQSSRPTELALLGAACVLIGVYRASKKPTTEIIPSASA
jgi:hypothetical protein